MLKQYGVMVKGQRFRLAVESTDPSSLIDGLPMSIVKRCSMIYDLDKNIRVRDRVNGLWFRLLHGYEIAEFKDLPIVDASTIC